MKRILKIVGYVLAAIILVIGSAAAFIAIKGVPHYEYQIPQEIASMKIETDSSAVERGLKIATLLCKECHGHPDGSLSGKPMADVPSEFGSVASYNITQDSIYGIGSWTDGELYYFLRTGIRKDGSWAPVFMPKFPLMADDDLKAVIAWLRSSDPGLKPDRKEYPKNKYNFLVKFLSNVAFKAPPLPEKRIEVPDSSDQIAFGRYLADDLVGCFACHSADFKTINDLVPSKSAGYYGGGNPMLNYEKKVVPSANITMDESTGIGKWSEQEFVDAVRYCKKPGGGSLVYPMFPHTTLTESEVRAIFAYLKTIPKINNPVARYMAKN